MDYRFLLATLLLAGYCCCCNELPDARPSNILVFLPTETESHFNGFKPLLEKLVVRGHNLTLVSPFPLSPTAEDGSSLLYKHIQVEIVKNTTDGMNHFDENSLSRRIPAYLFVLWLGPVITRNALEKPSVKGFIHNDGSSFDLVVFENFYHECFVALGHKYGAPVVQLLPFGTNPRVSQWHGNPYNPSYIADFVSAYAAPMTFWQRAENALAAVVNTWVSRAVYLPQQRSIMDEYFAYPGHERRPDLEAMLRNVSLTLVNSHPLIASAAPFVPSFVQVAGMHVKPAKPLPRDLKTLLDAAERGVVYFNMGSVLKSANMPREIVSLILSELAKIEQTVLWKWETENVPELPKNVIVRKWFPQNGILGHPNCRVFISHGGIHSLIESIHHGVPMLMLPVFGDQLHNAIEARQRGFALVAPYFELTAEEFGTKLQKLLRDPRYGKAAKRASSIMRDNPISTMDKAVFWIEYVIRHGGAPHLRTAANDLYWFQYYLLDVIGAALLTLVFVSYLNYKCFVYLRKRICGRKPKTEKLKNKQKKQ